MSTDRGVSSVISVILLVAIVVVLSGAIAIAALDVTTALREPAPRVAQSSGDFAPQDGTSGGIVTLTHIAGDPVAVSDTEIAVRADCDKGVRSGRIVHLPAGAGNAIRESDGQIAGANLFDERSLKAVDNAVADVGDGGALLQGGRYAVGDTIMFRIPESKCALATGSDVSVQVIHRPSQTVVIRKTMVA
ncbi:MULTISPECIES: type IV pilin [unclassified Halorubrum]|uniref:type IV pilin n=1 Tax=unclassified Halorubrum TaxID=2642239 RepID=UPI000B97D2D8|nr:MULTISPECIES: type IV pilin [unclassified Halorubrum]OYR43982.1 hypothetical protein DJ75_09810 [Halorubrum sp. Eb13]OYR44640.1 hypothetical protein DJ74_17390 [Halorubrum sp. Ea8]OYR45969.1 hypothetical protein DJ81_03985 [Halorubrum sp. Hd13]OYR51346.1 hypothetical protein DJ73_13775 [Halorubrum sp. Ea1]